MSAHMAEERLMNVILSPHVSEKGTRVGDEANQFVFRVLDNARKPEIKRAVEHMFKVDVESVQVVRMKGKRKGFQRVRGKRPDWKKAYVRLKPGQDIEFLGGE